MVVVDGKGLPLGSQLASASIHETRLIETTLEAIVTPEARANVERLIYDRAADSDPLRQRLLEQGVDLICPHRRNRKKPPTQDGRKLRRFSRRWIVERTFAWIGNFRRMVVRYERLIEMYRAFFHLACIMILLKRF
jgi:transposase